MSTSSSKSYHHGDLRHALITAARKLLADDEKFSLRAVATRAGVSPTASYRHFKDRQALESAIAAEGYRELLITLENAAAKITSEKQIYTLAVTYVNWAIANRSIFHLMFTSDCDPTDPQRIAAVTATSEFLIDFLKRWYPKHFSIPLKTGAWSLVHGLAVLHLEGKLDPEKCNQNVKDAWLAVFPVETST